MSRFRAVFLTDFRANLKRAFFWIWYALLALNAWLISTGNWIIRSVDTSVGTQKSFVNSEFQIAFVFALMPFLMLGIFMAIEAGTTVLRDSQWKVADILHTTPLTPNEYTWGKFLAVLANALVVIGLFVITLFFLNEIVPHPGSDIHGPIHLRNYIFPTIAFVLPALIFTASCAFAIGVFTRRTALVYLFPVALLLIAMNFLYYWYPPKFTDFQNYLMQCVDPSGFRWLKQTWFRVDRGVGFYNTRPIHYDAAFIAARLMYFVLCGAVVALSARHFARRYARIADARIVAKQDVVRQVIVEQARPVSSLTSASRHAMGLFRQVMTVANFELRELAAQPWLFLFIAFISIVVLMGDRSGAGELHLAQLYSTGLTAAAAFSPLTLLICFLLLFTNAESLAREESSGLGPLYYSTPVSTPALIAGKGLANFTVALFSIVVNVAAISAFVLYHHEAPLELKPFLYLYIYLMLPTFLFWTAFSLAAYSLTGRFGTYGAGIVLIAVTIWMIANNKGNWVTNWSLATSLVWSDFGSFDVDRKALILNRLFYMWLSLPLIAIAIRYFPRRTSDGRFTRVNRKRNLPLRLFRLAVIVLAPIFLGSLLYVEVVKGFEGKAAKRAQKDYWRRNISTYWRAPLPDRTFIDLSLRFEPDHRAFTANGSYTLINNNSEPLYRIPVTGVGSWSHLRWTLNGNEAHPEDRSGLFVFSLDEPLKPQQTMTLGFSYEGIMIPGVSKNGGYLELGEFVLPSGIVLTGRNPWFVPVMGFVDSIGVDEKNRYEPEDPDPHFYQKVITSGVDRSLMNTRIRIDVPEKFFATSMGVLTSEKVSDGRRTLVWESDYPVRVFNVCAAHWAVHRGKSSTIYYKPEHTANLDSIQQALDGARHYYSEWFGVYPWKELRLNEFPGISIYARGNPTNIFFSESIGFLTKDNMEDVVSFGLTAFGVTAHEAAHQWWGHMVSVGDAPGGIVLAEGMANFSVMCLLQQMQGDRLRQEFNRSLEAFYGENRAVGSERPIARSLFFRPADTTVIYDKGAWVFWMMRNLLGKDAMNAGLRSFIQKFHAGLDRPVSEDFVLHMRAYAPDPAAYDRFTQQWFFQVIMPEYRFLTKPEKHQFATGWETRARLKNVGTGRMPVEVAVIRGEEFVRDSGFDKAAITVTLGAGEETEVLIRSKFEPEQLAVDPDLNVLQLQRNAASFKFK